MKKCTFLLLALLFSAITFAQKKDKLKGSRTVTVSQKEVEHFHSLKVEDDMEVYLIKGDNSHIEIEADDNLHEALLAEDRQGQLILSFSKNITNYKKFIVRVFYTDGLKEVEARNQSKVLATETMILDNISLKSNESAVMALNIEAKQVTLKPDGNSEMQLNAKTETIQIEMNGKSDLKALIAATEIKCDLYEKSKAVIEGDVIDLKLRLDNNSDFMGKDLTAKNATILVESYANAAVLVENMLDFSASGNTETLLYGEPKITMTLFTDNAKLGKKSVK